MYVIFWSIYIISSIFSRFYVRLFHARFRRSDIFMSVILGGAKKTSRNLHNYEGEYTLWR